MKKASPLLILLLTLIGCTSESIQESLLDRMCGEWEFTGTEIREEWKKTAEDRYHVDVISYAGWEPELVQTIDLHRTAEDVLIYDGAILRDHNTTRPIRFQAVEISQDHILFENLVQEFPQNIRYTLIHQDKIRVKLRRKSKRQIP